MPLVSRVNRELWVSPLAHQMVGQGGPRIRIGGVEVTDDGVDRLVLRDGQGNGRTEVGRGFVHIRHGDREVAFHRRVELVLSLGTLME